MKRRPARDRIERALALGGLAAAAVLPFFFYLFRRLLRIPAREEREWAEIEKALYGREPRRAALREAVQ